MRCDDSGTKAIEPVYAAVQRPWWVWPLVVFAASRLCLFFVLQAGQGIGDLDKPIPWRLDGVPAIVDALSRWDAGWYLAIVGEGYTYSPDAQSSVAFFPLYPLAVKAVSLVAWEGSSIAMSFLLLSNLAFLGALLVLYRFAMRLTGREEVARTAVALMAFQPAAVFFSAPYTESLFLLLTLGSLLAALNRHWVTACILGLLCSATRNLGVFLTPAIGLMWLESRGIRWRDIFRRESLRLLVGALRDPEWLWVLLIPCGLFAYMAFLQLRFGNALAFVVTQEHWERQISGFWQVISEALGLLFVGAGDWNLFANVVSFITFTALGLIAWVRFGAGIGVYCLACVLIPASTDTASMVRFIAVVAPSFVVLALLLEKWRLSEAVIGFFAGLAGIFAVLYSHWVFVA